MSKKLGWVALGLLLLIIFGLSWTPYAIKRYAESHYPIKVESLSLHWGYCVFENVTVEREDVKGLLQSVRADLDHNVLITGGALMVDVDKLKSSSGSTKTGSLEGVGLKVKVVKGASEALLENARFDAKEVCFDSGNLRYKGHQALVTSGCLSRSDKKFWAKSVETQIELPFEIPRVEEQLTVKIEGVKADPSTMTVMGETASVAPFVKVKGPTTAHLGVNQTLLVSADNVEVNHPWVSPDPVTFAHLAISAPKSLDQLKITDGPVEVTVEPAKFHLTGNSSCNDWVEAMPTPRASALEQAKGHFSGNLAFEVTRDPSPKFTVKESCRFECGVEPLKSLRAGRVVYMAYDKNNKLFERTIGPGTKDWVSIASLPAHIGKAFITMEDPGFLGHRGIIPQALENSFKDNLKLGKFFRGGSTITMQLAKNLWLRRSKTLGRKAEEALLTTALESCLPKDKILELYLNAVEMGPDLYGLGAAAKRYFNKEAVDLEPVEAFYLASILPHPRNVVLPENGGLNHAHALMKTLSARGLINEALVPDEVDSSGWDTN